ncbi:putative CopG family antitoxin [Evansella vedderi]|uniref:CopG family antitoxin n=1 Tax=Evansella vedderi TaxID=38282 RepID=A0ABU0A3F8_9BACI|nr:hypothetical protein [Evansella vedderi]MDQ0258033.1 putative CopG family antitoxin [Evansella vedderi]
MKAILVEINSMKENKRDFSEMIEIAAIQMSVIDGMTIRGGTFHSYIRPVFLHWKLKRATHSQYSHWWLAPTFTQVMNDFQKWSDSIGNCPWLVWDEKVFSIWGRNALKHNYKIAWPSEVIYLKKEMLNRNILFSGRTSTSSFSKEGYTKNRINLFSEFLTNSLPLTNFKVYSFQAPIVPLVAILEQRESIVEKLDKLVNKKKVTLEEIAEWSSLSNYHVEEIFKKQRRLNKFERERLLEAWTMWETLNDFDQSWKET